MFWYTILSLIVGMLFASVAFSGAQRLAVISVMPISITSTIGDSMPRFFVRNVWYAYVLAIVWSISIIIALKQLPYDPKLDFHLPVFGTYNWTGIAISALYNYIIMMTKLFVVSVWNPKNFVMLKVPLQSTKMMENRAEMILVTAEKEKLYKKIGEDGQKLVTAIVSSPSDLPWEFTENTLKYMLFTRFRTDEKHQATNDAEFKVEMYTKQTLEQAYRSLFNFKAYVVMHEEKSTTVSPALPSKQILYRRINSPFPGVSDRLTCIKFVYRYYPEHGFAYVVTEDAERKYWDQIPKEVTEGTVRMTVRIGGYALEKVNSRKSMTKITYLFSSDIGGWMPVQVRNFFMKREVKRITKAWNRFKWNGEGPTLYSTEEAIEISEREEPIPSIYTQSRTSRMTTSRITSHRSRITSHRITSHRITSHRISSRHTTSQHITSRSKERPTK
eukprot:g454.t1